MSQLYREASGVLNDVLKHKGGLKSLTYVDKIQHKRSCYALVCQTLKYKPILDQLLETTKFQSALTKQERKGLNMNLVYVMLYDLLFSERQTIQGGGHLKKLVIKSKSSLNAALVRLKIKQKVTSNEELLPPDIRNPVQVARYGRINTLKISPEKARQEFQQQAEYDAHIANILRFPPGTELHEHPMVKNGELILQDKSSCFPAYVLAGERKCDGDLIDACAAPGNKTSHAAMLLHQYGGKVFAFDKSKNRLETLKKRMQAAGAAEIVTPCLQSFLEVDPADPKYKNVKNILLDPSCSGSGMSNRLEHLIDVQSSKEKAATDSNELADDSERVKSLAEFQVEILLKAFSFPQVERVSYSTCSIYRQENEDVVASVLEHQEQQNRPFVLKKCLPEWPRRGIATDRLTPEQSDCVVRALAPDDDTNGFFVAYFERTAADNGLADNAPKEKAKDRTEAQIARRKRKKKAQKERQKKQKVEN